ncbi:MAG TPA: serine/threonine-protein kinase [Kofleriaceae bacterium]|nr:serine/threonine-protein kinase [Kofleriaceae bacterium]
MIGETVGSYRILSKLSVGGMGTVFRAEHTLIGKLAAVKVLHPELSTSRDIVNRFFNEAKATTSIKHPGIVEVFDFGYMASGHAYLTMEFLEGMSLARRIKTRGKMSEGEATMLLRLVCSALSAAHAKGIVHRDLKPDNIFLVPDPDNAIGERPKLLDFGIAKLTDIGLAGTATKTGAVMGTPTYMAPEQCRGTGDVDHRADLYSIGCIFYELVTGRPPFTNLGAGELIGAHIYEKPERPSKHATIAEPTERLIMALLHKQPDRRPQTAKELAARLTALAQQLGWITAASPEGVTAAQGLPELSPADTDPFAMTHASEPPPSGSDAGLTTPFGMTSVSPSESSLLGPDPLAVPVTEKPTTLSGAASQSVVDAPPRRRRKLGVAMAALVIAGGAGVGGVAFLNHRADDARPVTTAQPIAAPAPSPTPTPTPPPQPPAPAPTPVVEPPAVTAPEPPPADPKPAIANDKPKQKPKLRPKPRPTTTTTPAKPAEPKQDHLLIEHDID